MLQFIPVQNDKYSLQEEVQMAIEGGCRWIQYDPSCLADQDIRTTALEIIEICRENDTFMIIEHDVELTKELGAFGVHLSADDMSIAMAREILGGEPIIGVTAHSAEEILRLRGLDIDYITVAPYSPIPAANQNTLNDETITKIIQTVREADMTIPIVAAGNISIDDLKPIMATGVNGVAVSTAIADAEDPVEYTSRLIRILENYKGTE